MTVQLKNNTDSTLRTAIDDTTTTIVVASGHGARFPALTGAQYFFATLEDSSGNYEIVKVTARSTDTLTVERAAESTTARAFAAGSTIEMRVTAQGIFDAASDAAAALALTDFGVTATSAELNILDGATVTTGELNSIAGLTATSAELNILDGATVTVSEINILDGVTATTAELNILDGVTVTAAELNILDGVTATTVEINTLSGMTSSTGELNLLSGVTWSLTDFNSLTPSVAELNILDGSTAATATTLADADRVVVNDDGTMVQVAMTDVRGYMLIDEDDMASDTATKAASQQSVRAYVGITNIATKTASGGSSLVFTELDATRYRGYKFEIFGLLPGTDGHDLCVQFSTDGGSTWITTSDYQWAITGNRTHGSYFDFRSGDSPADTAIQIAQNVGTGTGEDGLSASLTLYEPDASRDTILGGTGFFQRNDGDRHNCVLHGFLNATSAVNAVRFIAQNDASGTLASGTITMQGIPL